MKIAILSSACLSKKHAGTSKTVRKIAKYFAKTGHEVWILSACEPDHFRDEPLNVHRTDFGDRIHLIEFAGVAAKGLKTLSPRLLKNVVSNEYDRVLMIGNLNYTFALIELAMSWMDTPLFIMPQYHREGYLRYSPEARINTKALRLASKLPLYFSNPTVICYTPESKKFFKKLVSDVKVVPLPNFQEPSLNFADVAKTSTEEPFSILTIPGRVIPNKLPIYLPEIANKLKEKITNIKFHIVGEIANQSHYRKIVERADRLNVSKEFKFWGNISDEKLSTLFKKADSYLSLSYSESFGYTIIEALSNGIPTVATRTGIVPYLESKKAVLGADYGNVPEIVGNLFKIYQDSDIRRSLKKKGVEVLQNKFKKRNFFRKLSKIVLGSKSP